MQDSLDYSWEMFEDFTYFFMLQFKEKGGRNESKMTHTS